MWQNDAVQYYDMQLERGSLNDDPVIMTIWSRTSK